MAQKKIIESMFRRRLVLLFTFAIGFTFLQFAQLFRLSIVEGSERLAEAEKRLDLTTYLPTIRGRIIDRNGKQLAIDRPSYDVALHYSVITGAWALDEARKQAVRENRSQWDALSPAERVRMVEELLPEYENRIEDVLQEIVVLGEIERAELNRRIDAIKRDVQSMAADYWVRQRKAQISEQIKFGRSATKDKDFMVMPILEQKQAHVILPRVSDEVASVFRRIGEEEGYLGMVSVPSSHQRDYPWKEFEVTLDRSGLPSPIRSQMPITVQVTGIADHILGSVRDEVWHEEWVRRPFRNLATGKIDLGGYNPTNDIVGSRGLERVFEDHLRGLRGMIYHRLDTDSEKITKHVEGKDLQLTLDIKLQATIQAILNPSYGLSVVQPWQENKKLPVGTPLNSAAVVIEVQTGEILAMVSMPTIKMASGMNKTEQIRNQPYTNRPVEGIYPPGSIIKPLVLAAAITEEKVEIIEPITCTGHFFPEITNHTRCWIYRKPQFLTHGDLTATGALARSCNIYFYTLADRLKMDRLNDWFYRFGLGQRLDIGLIYYTDGSARGEMTGTLPDERRLANYKKVGETRSATIFMGIGQGPITWTPVQAANAYATIVRGGVIRDATLVRNDPRENNERRSQEDFSIAPSTVDAILEGLRQSVHERYGTGYRIRALGEPVINAKGVTVWAKTGTAQAPPWRAVDTNDDGKVNSKDDQIANDTNRDGRIDKNDAVIEELDHAWFVGLVGPKSSGKALPQYAITVVVEYGGSGGRTAGPIANQIIYALQDLEYLPKGEL